MAAYAAAFELWKSARSHLEHAIQGYLDASIALHDSLFVPPSVASLRSREQTLAKIDCELAALTSYTSTLRKARSYLCVARNTSYTISPISLLPSELLYPILVQVSQPNGDNHHTWKTQSYEAKVTAMSGVCCAWRRLMIRSPSFWVSLEVNLNHDRSESQLQLAKLWSERCIVADLSLTHNMGNGPYLSVATLADMLAPVMCRVRTLRMTAISSVNIESLLELWVTHGTMGRATSLVIHVPFNQGVAGGSRDAAGGTIAIHQDTFTSFFGSLRRLVLQNAWVGWRELIHAGLVELRLEDMHGWSPTLQDLIDVLKATPRLRVLSIREVELGSYSSQLDTVALDELEELRLSRWILLGAITSTSESIDLYLHGGRDQNQSAPRSFLARTKVRRLFAAARFPLDVGFFLTPMPHVSALVIDGLSLANETSKTAMQSLSVDIWPELSELRLISCLADSETLRQLILIHPPQTFVWRSPRLHRAKGRLLISEESVKNSLLGTGVEVVSSEKDEDLPTECWDLKGKLPDMYLL